MKIDVKLYMAQCLNGGYVEYTFKANNIELKMTTTEKYDFGKTYSIDIESDVVNFAQRTLEPSLLNEKVAVL